MKYDLSLTQKQRIANFNPELHKDLEQYANYILQDKPLSFNDLSLEMLTEEGVTSAENRNANKNFKIEKIKRGDIINSCTNLKDWYQLWANIDCLEYIIQFYETIHNKRSIGTPIRDKLYSRLRFSAETLNKDYYSLLAQLENISAAANENNYYKYCRQLVDLRKQQYTLLPQKNFSETFMHELDYLNKEDSTKIEIYPFNSLKLYQVYELMRQKPGLVFSREYYDEIIMGLKRADSPNKYRMDFRIPDNVKKFLHFYKDILLEAASGIEQKQQKDTFNAACKLYFKEIFDNPVLKQIFVLRMKGVENKIIQRQLVDNFNVFYRENYISTIFNKHIPEKIADAANEHYSLLEHILLGREEFKMCPKCGQIMPRTSLYFKKRKNNLDGYYNTCRKCGGGQRKNAK